MNVAKFTLSLITIFALAVGLSGRADAAEPTADYPDCNLAVTYSAAAHSLGKPTVTVPTGTVVRLNWRQPSAKTCILENEMIAEVKLKAQQLQGVYSEYGGYVFFDSLFNEITQANGAPFLLSHFVQNENARWNLAFKIFHYSVGVNPYWMSILKVESGTCHGAKDQLVVTTATGTFQPHEAVEGSTFVMHRSVTRCADRDSGQWY